MIEKVNPMHPDKIADRIAGAIVDYAYTLDDNPKIAVECLIGHNECKIIIETDQLLQNKEIKKIVKRITNDKNIDIQCKIVKQDEHLSDNQKEKIRCGDNGIFKGVPLTATEKCLSLFAKNLYRNFKYDGKFIATKEKLIICQSNVTMSEIKDVIKELPYKLPNEIIINPIGYWTGGTDVDTGAVNRKLGSDMAQSITGGGLHGKDLSKADVSVNIYAFLKAQKLNEEVKFCCAIGDEYIDGKPYSEIVEIAREYIKKCGGFEKFAEWGLF